MSHPDLAIRARRAFWRVPAPPPAHWLRVFRTAMACRFEVTLPADRSASVEAARVALSEADRIETAWSVFRDDSVIARVNRTAAQGAVRVDRELAELLAQCHRLSAATEGAFDITSTPLSRCWNLLERRGTVPTAETLVTARDLVGMQHVLLSGPQGECRPGVDASGTPAGEASGPHPPTATGRAPAGDATVRFDRSGVELNLGAIGKGYAVGRIAARLRAESVVPALVSAGDSSIEAVGAPAGGWVIALRGDGGASSGSVRLRRGALATSGSGEQGFVREGIRYSHIVDPRTGWPARGVLRVTVGADTAAEADALATAFLIGGPDLARRYIAGHPRTLAIMTLDAEARPRIMGRHPGIGVEVTCT